MKKNAFKTLSTVSEIFEKYYVLLLLIISSNNNITVK